MNDLGTNDIKPQNADSRLQAAMDRLSETAGDKFDDVLSGMAESLSEGVDTVSESVVRGLRDIKSELSVSKMAQENPWSLVVGSFVGGALFEYVTHRITDTSKASFSHSSASGGSSSGGTPSLMAAPIILALTRWGFTKVMSR